MPRNLLSFGNDAVRELVGIRLARSAFLSLRPSAELGVALSGPGLGSGRGLTAEATNKFSNVNFVSAVRAFHRPQDTTPTAYESCTISK